MLTAETITDEQIRELRREMAEERIYERWPDGTGAMMLVTDLALQSGRDDDPARRWTAERDRRLPTPAAVRNARARCAEILNAREALEWEHGRQPEQRVKRTR
jgi:hypothetical protein